MHKVLLALLVLVTTPIAARADAVAQADLDAALKRTASLHSGVNGKSLEQMIRGIKDPNAQYAATLYILAVTSGDVPAFMKLVPDSGLQLVHEIMNKSKKKLTRAQVEAQAKQLDQYKRPSFVGVLGDVADAKPSELDWNVELDKKKQVMVSANGAFAWATFKRAADGTYTIDRITISANDD